MDSFSGVRKTTRDFFAGDFFLAQVNGLGINEKCVYFSQTGKKGEI